MQGRTGKYLLIGSGAVLLGIEAVGVFVPLLPTTPFLLLAAACFLRSSEKLYHWITHHRLFGNYIRGYTRFRAVSMQNKIVAIALLWLSIGSSALFFITSAWLQILLAVIGVAVTIHIALLRTLTSAMIEQLKQREGIECN